jgi:glutathione S-transferase
MRYATVSEARAQTGLRLVLTAGAAAPWSEAAKAIFAVKRLRYLAVAQTPGGDNCELQEWTGQAAAPVAIHEDERPYSDALDILFLAERLAPTPALVPDDPEERLLSLGLSREVAGRLGLGWNRRLMLQAADLDGGRLTETQRRLMKRHDFQPIEADAAARRLALSLHHMAGLLHAQQRRGTAYFVGGALSCADIYWAAFSIMFRPMEPELCPMTEAKRARLANIGPVLEAALDPILIAHRDLIYREHIGLPMDFLCDG